MELDLKLVALGGSTTDPLGVQYSGVNGTWPELLAQKISSNLDANISLINAGVGGGTSSNELLRLLTLINMEEIDMVISLNGINEIDFLSSEFKNNQNIFGSKMVMSGFINDEVHFENKIYSSSLINNLNLKIKKYAYKTNLYKLFFIMSKINFKELENPNFFPKDTILKSTIKSELNLAAKYWTNNLKSMYAISKMQGINYFAFLQPTFGLDLDPFELEKIIENHNNENLNEPHLVLKSDKPISNEYLISINYLYFLLREKCRELSFCFDLSLDPNLNNNEKLYSDFRHHNLAGNNIISDKIFLSIKNILK